MPAGPQSAQAGDYIDQARQAAAKYGIDPEVFSRQIQQESGFNPNAKSPAGAQGIAQFMPGTAQGMGIDPMNPQQALDAAAKMDAQNLQKYQGDWGKTLAAYNAGPGNVDKYGGVPPFDETQTYVKNILGGAQNTVQNVAQQGLSAVNTAVDAAKSQIATRASQFGLGLSSGDAMAFCGPTAAIAFAQTYGRNPTVDEAKQLAQQVGWNAAQGMAGVGSEVKLLQAMGVDAHATQGVDWAQVGRDASGGNPVIIDTPGHYYYVDGYNAQTGQMHVGTSGTDLKGGSEWMTPAQINAMPQSHGDARSAVFADHPLAQQDGLAQSVGDAIGTVSRIGQLTSPQGIASLGVQAGQALNPAGAGPLLDQSRQLAGNILGGAASAVQGKVNDISRAVLDIGGTPPSTSPLQGLQDQLQQTQQVPQSVGDLLSQNAMTAAGIPNVAGKALADVGNLQLPGVLQSLASSPATLGDVGSTVADLATGGITRRFNDTLQDLTQNVLGLQPPDIDVSQGIKPLGDVLERATSQSDIPGVSGLGALGGGFLRQPGPLESLQTIDQLESKYGNRDTSTWSPEDQRAYGQSLVAVGGIFTTPHGTAGPARPPTPAPSTAPMSLGDWLQGLYKGGVISGLNTMADVAFNATLSPMLSGVTGAARDLASFQPGRVQGRVLGAQSGMVNWTNNFLQGLSDSLARPTSLSARAGGGLPGVLANVFEGAGALHGAFQNATSQLIQAMEHGAASGEAASAAGHSGPAWFTEFQRQFAQPVSPEVQAMGDRAAGRGDLGTLTSAFGKFVTQAGPVGDALFPVYRMGMALASRMVEGSPLGLAGTAFDVARGLAGRGPYAAGLGSTPAGSAVGPLSERLTNNLIGTALSVWLASKATSGAITGNGPTDPGERRVWQGDGNQPNSFLGPDGAYHSWEKLPPQLKGPMMMAGAYADAVQAYNKQAAKQAAAGPQAYGVEDPRVSAAAQLVSEVGTQLASATPMRTFANLYDALQSGGVAATGLRGATDTASSMLGGLVPESGLVRSVAQMTDPLQRQPLQAETSQQLPQSIAENVLQNIPGFRENLPAPVDVLGRQMSNPLQGLGELLPVRTAAGQPSSILQMMQTAGVAPSGAPQAVPFGAFEVRLTPQERLQWESLRGNLLQQMAGPLANSPTFQQAPQKTQQIAMKNINAAATAAASRMMTAQIAQTGDGLARAEARAGGALAPVVGYSPDVLSNQQFLQQQLQHRALMQSLLGAA